MSIEKKRVPVSAGSLLHGLMLIAVSLIEIEVAVAQTRPLPSTIRGRVVSRAKEPIPEAEVSIIGTPNRVITDSMGSFSLRGIAPETVMLRVRRIGFKGQFLRVTLRPGESVGTEIMLDPGPQLLPEVTVTAKSAKPLEFAWTTKYDDYFRRSSLGFPGGTFISAEKVKRRGASHTYELLEQYVPGARVNVHFPGWGGTEVVFPRCNRAFGYVEVWVDGKRVSRGSHYQEAPLIFDKSAGRGKVSTGGVEATELADALDQVHPSEIQFMEVYRGIGSIPGEFSGGCGAIVIWTR